MFNGERGRGAYVKYGIGNNMYIHGGVWDALTITDPEQANLAAGPRGKLAYTGGLRYDSNHLDIGVSYIDGTRPEYAVTTGSTMVKSPEIRRRFGYVDATYVGLFNTKLFVRGEFMMGRDRVPTGSASTTATGNRMLGWQTQVGYTINPRNVVNLRFEQFDPNSNKSSKGDAVRGYGLAYNYYINPGARLTLAYEIFEDPARKPKRFNVATIRLQFKY